LRRQTGRMGSGSGVPSSGPSRNSQRGSSPARKRATPGQG
jgi:hypothetical protein